MKRIFLLFVIMLLSVNLALSQKYTDNINRVLSLTENKDEIKKALDYFYKTGDKVKIAAINFIVENIAIHKSKNYYWADLTGKKVPFNELGYSDFKSAIEGFEQLKQKYGKLYPVTYSYNDMDSIKANMLINTVELSISEYEKRFGKLNLNDSLFLEYVLPYRTSIEPIQDWREVYSRVFKGVIANGNAPIDSQVLGIGKNIKTWFTNTYKIESREDPLPRLGALQLLLRKKGACEDIADLAAFIARSQGYPAAVDYIPGWGTASGVHFLNYIYFTSSVKSHYDAADGYILDTLAREPSKVLRTTFSIQKSSLAYQLQDDTLQIPDNFLRLQNYKDVTNEYWKTSDVPVELFTSKNANTRAAYLCVWNTANWRPIWYSILDNNSQKTVFSNMTKGVAYLPVYYYNRKTQPAGWPVINDNSGTYTLQPDTLKRRNIRITEEPKYLAFRTGKKYRLFYWNNRWVPLGDRVPDQNTKELTYDEVPRNALLILIPEYTQGKERPFIVDETGKRLWF